MCRKCDQFHGLFDFSRSDGGAEFAAAEPLPKSPNKTAILNASEFGLPQIRKRAFIVALREDLGLANFEFPQGDYDERTPLLLRSALKSCAR